MDWANELAGHRQPPDLGDEMKMIWWTAARPQRTAKPFLPVNPFFRGYTRKADGVVPGFVFVKITQFMNDTSPVSITIFLKSHRGQSKNCRHDEVIQNKFRCANGGGLVQDAQDNPVQRKASSHPVFGYQPQRLYRSGAVWPTSGLKVG